MATNLPMKDALACRQVSRASWPTIHAQQFWASRFRPGFERDWLFEAGETRGPRDWSWLYRESNNNRLGTSLQNSKRIWELLVEIKELLALQWSGPPASWSSDIVIPDRNLWLSVTGELCEPRCQPSSVSNGCRGSHKRRVSIERDTSRFSASYITLGESSFITGARFNDSTGEVIQLGY